MPREYVNFDMVPERQADIHLRLEQWAKWVKPGRQGWMTQPMFRQYRSHAWQWEAPDVKVEIDRNEAVETERVISGMDVISRNALRWYYVWKGNPSKVAKSLSLSMQGLALLVIQSRDILVVNLRHAPIHLQA